jgi:E3 ubiquitin-protein ligase BOI-like protein
VLQQQREQQVGLLRSLETYSHQVLITKNEEIARVALKNKVLENLLNSLEAEKKELKIIVEEREAMVIALHKRMEEEKMRVRMFVENDAESCCGEIEEARAAKYLRSEVNIGCCLRCKTKSSGVLFLPCRHLSSCKGCEALLQACPICGVEKKGAIPSLQTSLFMQSFISD